MRTREHARRAILLCEIAQQPRDVERNGPRPPVARDALVLVDGLHRAAGPRDVDRVRPQQRRRVRAAQVPRHDLIDDGVVHQVDEFLALVEQRPDALVGLGRSAVEGGYAEFALACCLLLGCFLENGDLLGGEGIFDQAGGSL